MNETETKKEETEQKPKLTGDKLVERNPDGTIKSGALNPNGRPVGALSFATKWDKFIEKVAKQNDMTPEEIDEQLFAVGFKKAKDGDFQFYKDIHDRKYGKAVQPTELKGNIEVEIKKINYIVPEQPKTNETGNGNQPNPDA